MFLHSFRPPTPKPQPKPHPQTPPTSSTTSKLLSFLQTLPCPVTKPSNQWIPLWPPSNSGCQEWFSSSLALWVWLAMYSLSSLWYFMRLRIRLISYWSTWQSLTFCSLLSVSMSLQFLMFFSGFSRIGTGLLILILFIL